jgi:pyruvyltransferase
MKAYWHHGDEIDGGRNFGDILTPVLFERLAGIRLEWAPPEQAELFAVGSIAAEIPPGFTGIVFGSGKMWEGTGLDLGAARVLALRGELTRAWSGAQCELLADPGLLAGLLAPSRRRIRHEIGFLPHFADDAPVDGHRIDILAGVDEVIAEVAGCEAIITSSLHALILADALGIPNRWDPAPAVLGDGFKFQDYASAYDTSIVPGVWRLADQAAVAAKQDALLEALRSVSRLEVAA